MPKSLKLPPEQRIPDLARLVAGYGWEIGSQQVGSPSTFQTFQRWRARAAAGDEPYAGWFAAFETEYEQARNGLAGRTEDIAWLGPWG